MQKKLTMINGCCELQPRLRRDERGWFVKTFHQDIFSDFGLETYFSEEYYSVSHRSVLRGMHFQTPPYDHFKLVYCLFGKVMDVIVDLRKGSPTYQQAISLELSAEKANMIYIPPGLAHGFYTLSELAIMVYKVTTIYMPDHDAGILWNSFDQEWPNECPIISKRDSEFPALCDFDSPFTYTTLII